MDADWRRRLRPVYAVVFETASSPEDAAAYQPLLDADEARRQLDQSTVPHGLDNDVVPALPALRYCLHLPRSALDVSVPSARAVRTAQLVGWPHRIWLVPRDGLAFAAADPVGVPVLALCPDALLDEVAGLTARLGFALPAERFSSLDDRALARHWSAIAGLLGTPGEDDAGTLVPASSALGVVLPLRQLARALGRPVDAADEVDPFSPDAVAAAVGARGAIAGLAALPESPEPSAAQAREAVGRARARETLPMMFAAAGVAPAYARALRKQRGAGPVGRAAGDDGTPGPGGVDAAERSAIDVLVAHHAAGADGLGMALADIPPDAFRVLADLERHWTAGPSGQKVAKLLARLDRLTAHLWTPQAVAALSRASSVTAFSGFPLGLLTPPGGDAPLACRVPVAQRPLVPLTRAVQLATPIGAARDLSAGLSIVVVECIPRSDPVGVMSRHGWSVGADLFTDRADVTYQVLDAPDVAALRAAVYRHRPDVLVISAHGTHLPGSGAAALAIGGQPCLGPELGPMPPVVVLSACHVSPRGTGAVSVADMLLREGATAVLGTLVPVDVRRNATLMVRLFVYMLEVLAGRAEHATLLEAWHRVQASNAIHDVISGNERMHAWAMTGGPGGSPMAEFKNSRSVGRVRLPFVYSDTVAVLAEIARDRGAADQFAAWMATGYVPETSLYALLGEPERIRLRAPDV